MSVLWWPRVNDSATTQASWRQSVLCLFEWALYAAAGGPRLARGLVNPVERSMSAATSEIATLDSRRGAGTDSTGPAGPSRTGDCLGAGPNPYRRPHQGGPCATDARRSTHVGASAIPPTLESRVTPASEQRQRRRTRPGRVRKRLRISARTYTGATTPGGRRPPRAPRRRRRGVRRSAVPCRCRCG